MPVKILALAFLLLSAPAWAQQRPQMMGQQQKPPSPEQVQAELRMKIATATAEAAQFQALAAQRADVIEEAKAKADQLAAFWKAYVGEPK